MSTPNVPDKSATNRLTMLDRAYIAIQLFDAWDLANSVKGY